MRWPLGLFAVIGLVLSMTTVASAGPLRDARTNAEIFAGDTRDPYVLAVRAYVWGYPLVRAAQLRLNATRPNDPFSQRPPTVAGAPLNRLGVARALATPETRIGVAPNNDTLYVLAFLNTSTGSFVLESPDFGERYYTFQFGQADTTTEQSLGQRTHGGKLPPIFIHGPRFGGRAPEGMAVVASRQRYLMIAGRILVDGPADLPVAHALQDRIHLRRWTARGSDPMTPVPPQRPLLDAAGSVPSELQFLSMLAAVLRDWRPTPDEKALIASLHRIGLSREQGFESDSLGASQRAAVAEGLADGDAAVRARTHNLRRNADGWSVNDLGPQFGEDHLLRAAVAMDQIYILQPEEAVYASARVDSGGALLQGGNRYRVFFPATALPPVGAFWSITLYHDRGFMAANSIDRWSIGDRTPSLAFSPDGSLEILIQHERPADVSNWLPAPEGGFMLLMRLYLPLRPVLSGEWMPPSIQNLSN